ncbi:MAG: hypothetical protein GY898_28650 [Proteobacteria bacterium]|nr:hypothetical protein [Pseudomonadota bacterium]
MLESDQAEAAEPRLTRVREALASLADEVEATVTDETTPLLRRTLYYLAHAHCVGKAGGEAELVIEKLESLQPTGPERAQITELLGWCEFPPAQPEPTPEPQPDAQELGRRMAKSEELREMGLADASSTLARSVLQVWEAVYAGGDPGALYMAGWAAHSLGEQETARRHLSEYLVVADGGEYTSAAMDLLRQMERPVVKPEPTPAPVAEPETPAPPSWRSIKVARVTPGNQSDVSAAVRHHEPAAHSGFGLRYVASCSSRCSHTVTIGGGGSSPNLVIKFAAEQVVLLSGSAISADKHDIDSFWRNGNVGNPVEILVTAESLTVMVGGARLGPFPNREGLNPDDPIRLSVALSAGAQLRDLVLEPLASR